MKIKTLVALAFCLCISCSEENMESVIERGLNRAQEQCLAMAESLMDKDGLLPRSVDTSGNLSTSGSEWWTSGFFAGSLWYLYENSRDERLLKYAEEYTARVEKEQYTTNNHDVGFMIFCSFGNGLRITDNQDYWPVIIQAAKSLSTRYRTETGVIRSWDDHTDKWQYPVIIDNMMNLEMLYWAGKESDNSSFIEIARSHADKTMANHYREDYSCYHVIGYDPETGKVLQKNTNQGYAHESSWARGQAWGLYGFTMMYRESGDLNYLLFAEKIADYMLHHPRMPEDLVPYWDYDDPDIPAAERDASAAAITASALIELSGLTTSPVLSQEYKSAAETILRTLSSKEYLAEPGNNANFVLKHSVGNMPLNLEIDVPLVYTDYYYIEALMRYKKAFVRK